MTPDAIGDVVHDGEVVRDEQEREAELALQAAHQVEHLRLHRHVERRGRLVADQERRVAGQRPRDRDALALSAGELVRELLPVGAAEADLLEQARDARLDPRSPCDAAPAPRAQRLGDDVARRASAD